MQNSIHACLTIHVHPYAIQHLNFVPCVCQIQSSSEHATVVIQSSSEHATVARVRRVGIAGLFAPQAWYHVPPFLAAFADPTFQMTQSQAIPTGMGFCFVTGVKIFSTIYHVKHIPTGYVCSQETPQVELSALHNIFGGDEIRSPKGNNNFLPKPGSCCNSFITSDIQT